MNIESYGTTKLKRHLLGFAGVFICILFVYVLKTPEGLEISAIRAGSNGHAAMSILGITLLSIVWWVGGVVPEWLTSVMMMILWVVIGNVPFNLSFSSFAESSVWLIVGAFCLAAAVTKTGLFKRVAYLLIKAFSPTFSGQVLALLIVGTICSPLIPSVTAKVVLGASIAFNIANAMGYESDSPGRYGIFMAAWFGFGLTISAFKTGSIQGYTLLGALPKEVSSKITFVNWFIAMIPWLIIFLICSYFAIKTLYKPIEEITLKKRTILADSYNKMSGKEKISAVILAFTIVFWILEAKLQINSTITALLAAFFCFLFNILDGREISTAVPWEFVIFLGGVLNLGNVLSTVGLDVWMQNLISPVFRNLNNIYVIIMLIIISVLLVRLVVVSQNASIIILLTILSPILTPFGISPFIVGIIIFTFQACWFLPYQNIIFSAGLAGMKNTIGFRNTIKACLAYIIINFIAIFASIPYWKLLGYL
jgi:DASS family divalent anion:Na+ symporter